MLIFQPIRVLSLKWIPKSKYRQVHHPGAFSVNYRGIILVLSLLAGVISLVPDHRLELKVGMRGSLPGDRVFQLHASLFFEAVRSGLSAGWGKR